MKRWQFIAMAGLLLGAATIPAAQVGLIKIDGAIGPATESYIARAINEAAVQNDECLIIQLDTPGGLLESTKQIVQTFYASESADRGLCRAVRRERGERGCFHHSGRRCGSDGTQHQHRRGPSGRDRHHWQRGKD